MEDGEKKTNSNNTVFVGVRIIPEARDRLFKLAQLERRSVSKQIEHIIMQQLDKQ